MEPTPISKVAELITASDEKWPSRLQDFLAWHEPKRRELAARLHRSITERAGANWLRDDVLGEVSIAEVEFLLWLREDPTRLASVRSYDGMLYARSRSGVNYLLEHMAAPMSGMASVMRRRRSILAAMHHLRDIDGKDVSVEEAVSEVNYRRRQTSNPSKRGADASAADLSPQSVIQDSPNDSWVPPQSSDLANALLSLLAVDLKSAVLSRLVIESITVEGLSQKVAVRNIARAAAVQPQEVLAALQQLEEHLH